MKETGCGTGKLQKAAQAEDCKENIYDRPQQPIRFQTLHSNELTKAIEQAAVASLHSNDETRRAIEDLAERHRKQMLKDAKEALKKK